MGTGRSLLIAPLPINQMHQHKLIQLNLASSPFRVQIKGEEWVQTKCVVIGTNVQHQVHGITGHQITIHIMPDNIRGKNLESFLKGKKVIYPEDVNADEYYNRFMECVNDNVDCTKAFRIFDEAIDHVTKSDGFEGAIDNRILTALNFINIRLNTSMSASEIAESLHLSEGRFLHLFSEQLGIPFRHYILFQRITLASKLFMEGESLTEAALSAGFSDSAHFTRTYTAMYGIKPSTFAKLKHLFNIHFCLPPQLK